ncbi:hypothetical protein B0T17DRAFT_505695 [Bombardia bombarda]|uniref:Uncharacterized protein n=1 Tax=Bombardia bombarda TaxID=252184 RepID=A0AA39X8X2_9PEZI|nr:hypothetical protein B0T17DRAFT_505695 [Bombardia bombarda]
MDCTEAAIFVCTKIKRFPGLGAADGPREEAAVFPELQVPGPPRAVSGALRGSFFSPTCCVVQRTGQAQSTGRFRENMNTPSSTPPAQSIEYETERNLRPRQSAFTKIDHTHLPRTRKSSPLTHTANSQVTYRAAASRGEFSVQADHPKSAAMALVGNNAAPAAHGELRQANLHYVEK